MSYVSTASGKKACTWKLCVGSEQYCRRKNSVVISGRQIRETGSQTKHRWLIHLFSRFLGNHVLISVKCCPNSGQFYEFCVLFFGGCCQWVLSRNHCSFQLLFIVFSLFCSSCSFSPRTFKMELSWSLTRACLRRDCENVCAIVRMEM